MKTHTIVCISREEIHICKVDRGAEGDMPGHVVARPCRYVDLYLSMQEHVCEKHELIKREEIDNTIFAIL